HASRISKSCGCSVGSPPEICTTSGERSFATIRSSIFSSCGMVRCVSRCGPLAAKQVGQRRLQKSVISRTLTQPCCSWSGQIPQSYGQPHSVLVLYFSTCSGGLRNTSRHSRKYSTSSDNSTRSTPCSRHRFQRNTLSPSISSFASQTTKH